VKYSGSRPRLRFTGGGRGLAVHAGARLLADLADKTGLTVALSEAMGPTKVRDRGHDRGRVLVDAAVMIADGGEAIIDIDALGQQPSLFGEVASVSTLWRVLDVARSQRQPSTIGLSRGELEGLVAGAGRVVAALNSSQARCANEFIGSAVPRLSVLCSVTPCR